MLQYKVSELIKQARSKADLQNSDFITHEDDIHLLNDIWLDLYQKAIDAGEQFFLKTVEDVPDVLTLPSDFFQLYSLKTKSGFEIPRRTVAELNNFYRGYIIKNNKLYVYNCTEPVVMEYFPTPATLTYPFKPKKYSFTDKYICGKDNKVYSANSVLDLETNEIETFSDAEAELYQVYADCIITMKETEDVKHFSIYDIQTLDLIHSFDSSSHLFPIQDTAGKTFILNWSNGTLFDSTGENIVLVHLDTTGTPSENMVLLDDDRIAILEGYSAFWNNEGNLFYTDKRNIINVFIPEENVYMNAGYEQRGVILCDDPITGNGIWFNNTLYSASKDMVLNYPNNLFYSAISYRLSVHYKIKQNEDATNLSALAEEAMYSYFDTVTQDDNEPVRIKNVY